MLTMDICDIIQKHVSATCWIHGSCHNPPLWVITFIDYYISHQSHSASRSFLFRFWNKIRRKLLIFSYILETFHISLCFLIIDCACNNCWMCTNYGTECYRCEIWKSIYEVTHNWWIMTVYRNIAGWTYIYLIYRNKHTFCGIKSQSFHTWETNVIKWCWSLTNCLYIAFCLLRTRLSIL